MKPQKKHCKDINTLRRTQGKRTLADYETCKIELQNEIQRLFIVFEKALQRAYKTINEYPIQYRGRGFEPSVMQTAIMTELKKEFPSEAFFGKYKRIILRKNGYIILFKKLDKKGYPMNIKTTNVQNIFNQNQTLDLFANSDYNDEPILFFGYQKNKYGAIDNPQLVYIDDAEINFNILQNEIEPFAIVKLESEQPKEIATPKLKQKQIEKQA